MNLRDLGNIGEFVGAIAVVVSMVYLAIQVRRNTQSLDASLLRFQPAKPVIDVLERIHPRLAF